MTTCLTLWHHFKRRHLFPGCKKPAHYPTYVCNGRGAKEDVGGGKKKRKWEYRNKGPGSQPNLHSLIPGQLEGLCQWQGCHSPCYKLMNCRNDFETIITLSVWKTYCHRFQLHAGWSPLTLLGFTLELDNVHDKFCGIYLTFVSLDPWKDVSNKGLHRQSNSNEAQTRKPLRWFHPNVTQSSE